MGCPVLYHKNEEKGSYAIKDWHSLENKIKGKYVWINEYNEEDLILLEEGSVLC